MKYINIPPYNTSYISGGMASQTKRLIQLIIALGGNDLADENETIDDIICVSSIYTDFYNYIRSGECEDVSIRMYSYLASFAYTNRVFRICDVRCGYNPLQSLMFAMLDNRFEYTGIQEKVKDKKYFDISLLEISDEFNRNQVKYIGGQMPIKIYDIWEPDRGSHKTFGCFLFIDKFGHLVMPIQDDITVDHIMRNTRDTEKIEMLFNYVAFTVPYNYTTSMFAESALNDLYDVMEITEPFSDSNGMNRLVILESKNKDNRLKDYETYRRKDKNVRF